MSYQDCDTWSSHPDHGASETLLLNEDSTPVTVEAQQPVNTAQQPAIAFPPAADFPLSMRAAAGWLGCSDMSVKRWAERFAAAHCPLLDRSGKLTQHGYEVLSGWRSANDATGCTIEDYAEQARPAPAPGALAVASKLPDADPSGYSAGFQQPSSYLARQPGTSRAVYKRPD